MNVIKTICLSFHTRFIVLLSGQIKYIYKNENQPVTLEGKRFSFRQAKSSFCRDEINSQVLFADKSHLRFFLE